MSVESHKTGMPAEPAEDNWQSSTKSDDHAWDAAVSAPVSAIDSSWSAPVPVPLIAAHEVGVHADSTWKATSERAATVDLDVEDIEIQSASAPRPRHPAAARMSTIRGHGREPTVVVRPLPSPAGASGGHPAIESRPFSARFAPRPPRRRWVTLGVTAAIAGAIAFVAPRLSSQPQVIGPAATATGAAPPPAAVAPVSPSPAAAAVTATPPGAQPEAAPAPPRATAADRHTKAAALAVTKPTTNSASAATNQRAKPALKPSPRDADRATAKPGAKAARPVHQPATGKLASKPVAKPAASKGAPAKTKPVAAKSSLLR